MNHRNFTLILLCMSCIFTVVEFTRMAPGMIKDITAIVITLQIIGLFLIAFLHHIINKIE